MHGLEDFPKAAAIRRPKGELFDRIQPIVDPLERAERLEQPAPQHSAAHRRDGAIDLVEQRSLRSAFAARDDLQVLQRDRIDQQAVGGGPVGDRAHVCEVGLLCIAEVGDESAGRLNRAGPAIEAEAVEPVRLELIEQRAARGLGLETPRIR